MNIFFFSYDHQTNDRRKKCSLSSTGSRESLNEFKFRAFYSLFQADDSFYIQMDLVIIEQKKIGVGLFYGLNLKCQFMLVCYNSMKKLQVVTRLPIIPENLRHVIINIPTHLHFTLTICATIRPWESKFELIQLIQQESISVDLVISKGIL